MQRATNIQTELNELSSTIANIPFVHIYTIPNNFFTTLPLLINAKIASNNTFTVPTNYFETLSTTILNKIKEEQDEVLPAIFSSIGKQNVYKVPTNYFDKNIVLPNKEVKVVAMPKRSKTAWLKYAAAACLVSIVAFTAINFWNKKENPTVNNDTVINGTSLTYKQIQQINVDTALDSLSSKEVDDYLCLNGLVVCNEDKKEDEALQKTLEDLNLSDEDLSKVLEESN